MFIKNANIVARKIHDTYFLIDITQNYLDDKCRLYEINDMGNFIWQQLDTLENISDIVDLLVRSISEDVDKTVVNEDVRAFVNILINEGFLEVVDGTD